MSEGSVFIRSNSLNDLVEIIVAGNSVLETYEQVIPRLTALAGADAASLFARPSLVRGNGETETMVSWYVARPGPIKTWRDLDAETRVRIGAEMARLLDRIRSHLNDPEIGHILSAWLNLPSLDANLVVVGSRPHILNWGTLPREIANDAAARDAHAQSTLGLFGQPSMPLTGGVAGTAALGNNSTETGAQAVDAIALHSESRAHGLNASNRTMDQGVRRPWLPVAVAAAVAAIILLILLIPGVLVYDAGSVSARLTPALDDSLRRQVDESLRQRIEGLQRELAENVCRPVDGRRAGGIPPLGGNSPAGATRATLPPAPSSLPPPIAATKNGAPQAANLVSYLDQAVALVVAGKREGEGASLGTGFFVNDTHIVTNRHVVENADPSQVALVSPAFGRLTPGRIVAVSSSSDFGSPDFALIEVASAPRPQVLTLTGPVERMQNVIATGFPGFVMETDATYHRLQQGDPTAIPQPVVTQGSVVALQTGADELPIIVHTATIAQGNSGGPLVDSCGRVLGVNTFGRFDQESVLRLNFALRTDGLRSFLDQNGVAYTFDDAPCVLPTERAQAPAMAPRSASDEPSASTGKPAARP
jgi:S1-C subfamily serine protease